MKNAVIFCDIKKVNETTKLNFYLKTKTEVIFLFQQKYRKGAYNYYKNGCRFDDALNYKKAHNDAAIMNIIKRLKKALPYIQKEYGITLYSKKRYSEYKDYFAA